MFVASASVGWSVFFSFLWLLLIVFLFFHSVSLILQTKNAYNKVKLIVDKCVVHKQMVVAECERFFGHIEYSMRRNLDYTE